MVEFSDAKSLQSWLEDKPREWVVLLSASATLRIIPFLSDAIDLEDSRSEYMLPIFRYLSMSLAYSVSPSSLFLTLSMKTSSNISKKFFEFATSNDRLDSIEVAINAMYSKESIETINTDRNIIISNNIWNGGGLDVPDLEDGESAFAILSKPLWREYDEPNWSKQRWEELKAHLNQAPDEHWHVWTDWWEDRRDGKPYNIEMEREIVLIPDEDWQRGPAHVNAMIAEIRARYAAKEMPADNPVAPRFVTHGDRIAVRHEPPEDGPDDEQTELYDALRERARELGALCPENSNRYGPQGKAAAAFLAALGDGYASMRLTTLWIAGESLRRFERADADKRAADDPDDEPMEADQGAVLSEVVTIYNHFSTVQPALHAKNAMGRDPATLSPDVTAEAKAVRSAVGETPALFEEEAVYVLDQVIEETDDPVPGVQARGVVLTRETFENLLGALARKARGEAKPDPSEVGKNARSEAGKILTTGGAATGASVASAFIAYYEATLIAFASKLPAGPVWVEIIRKIASLWPGL